MPALTRVTDTILTFRDRMRDRWAPPWLSRKNGERFLYAIALQADVFGDALVAGIASRFPGMYGFESLSVIGRERRIARGPLESDETYASRLRRWLDDHRRRGGPYAMLAQLHAYYAPENFTIDLLYRSGRHFQQLANGTITRTISDTNFDGEPSRWARWWLIFTGTRFDIEALTPAQLADIQHVPREWNADHCLGTIVLLTPDAELYNWPRGRPYNRSVPYNNPAPALRLNVDL